MAYSCSISLVSIEGESLPNLNATLWALWTALGTGTGSGPQQVAREGMNVPSTGTINVSFAAGPDNNDISRDIALSVQEEPGVADDTGWLFRSGKFSSLPSPGNVDIVVTGPARFDGPGLLAENVIARDLPLTLGDGTTVTTMTAAPVPGGFNLTIAGTSPAAFSHTVTVTLRPSSDQTSIGTILDWSVADAGMDSGSVTTAARNFAVARAAEVVGDITAITEQVAISSYANVVSPPPAAGTRSGPLAAGVTCSVRRVVATSSGVAVFPALGAFGSVAAVQFPQREPAGGGSGGGGGRICSFASLATLLDLRLDLGAFRAYRDTVLSQKPAGRRLIDTYYRDGPEALRLIVSDPDLCSAAGSCLALLENDLSRVGRPTERTLRAVRQLAGELEKLAPPRLARIVRRSLWDYAEAYSL
jgi:hypothetical protein